MSEATCEHRGLRSLHFAFADLGRAGLRSQIIGKIVDREPDRFVGGPRQ